MYLPPSYAIALLFMICSMLCWGSWANTMKLCPGYRFQLFYWDYIIGLFVGIVVLGLTLGNAGAIGKPFVQDVLDAPSGAIVLAICSGAIFNVANLLLVAAIEIAGMAVAFPIGIGIALIVGALSSYLISPKGNPLLLFGGIALVVAAIICDSLAYRTREAARSGSNVRGIVISLISGVLMGTFYPLVSKVHGAVQRARPLRNSPLLRYWDCVMRTAGELFLHAEADRRRTPCHDVRLHGRPRSMAHCGYPGWRDLGLRSHSQLRSLARKFRRSGNLLLHRTRCDHGLGFLGGLCLARVRIAIIARSQSSCRNVRLFSCWSCRNRSCATLPKLTRIAA